MEVISGNELTMVISCIFGNMSVKSCAMRLMGSPTMFDCQEIPRIPIREYLDRIRTRTLCSNACFIISIIYIDRLMQCMRISVNTYNVHKLLLTSIMLASKFSDDTFCSNSYFAEVGGVSLEEMNLLEYYFLASISFDLFVHESQYAQYFNGLVRHLHCSTCSCCCRYYWRESHFVDDCLSHQLLYPNPANYSACSQDASPWACSPVSLHVDWHSDSSPVVYSQELFEPPLSSIQMPVHIGNDGEYYQRAPLLNANPDYVWSVDNPWY